MSDAQNSAAVTIVTNKSSDSAMSSPNPNVGKSLSSTSAQAPSFSPTAPSANFESSRRPMLMGTSSSQSTARKAQGSRKQHRNQHRPGGTNVPLDRDDAMAEARALRNPSSRRGQTSITHLLNYSVSSPRYQHEHNSYARGYRRNPTWGPGSGYHASDKARYIHANYRFVVSPEGDYSKQAVDADLHLDWSSVSQIIASSESQVASCPICLSEPVAPRMAKCGHIFCLPCVIRFMNASSVDDEKKPKGARFKKCPICEDSVYLQEVRPVRFYAGQESPLPRVGDDVVLRLMSRSARSTLALPREGRSEVIGSDEEIPWHFAANVLDYARIMKGTRHYMEEQYDEEIEALQKQEKEDGMLFGEDGDWTQRAIKAITTAKESLVEWKEAEVLAAVQPSNPAKPSQAADFNFYSSPPHLYLSPLDIRILKTKYGSFSSFPSTLLPRIELISTGHVVDDALRKRAKYLNHLPRGCVVSFLECDWTDIVSADVLESFAADIDKRRRRNLDKAAQEERERSEAERIDAAAMRSAAGARRNADFDEEGETRAIMDMSDFQPLSSFSGTTPPNPRNGFTSLETMSTSPSTHTTIWGTRAIDGSPELPPHPSGDDGWFGVADLSLQASLLQEEDEVESPGPSRGKGKKKKQKITLMSTGGRRGL